MGFNQESGQEVATEQKRTRRLEMKGRKRVSRGVPTGGQFASQNKEEGGPITGVKEDPADWLSRMEKYCSYGKTIPSEIVGFQYVDLNPKDLSDIERMSNLEIFPEGLTSGVIRQLPTLDLKPTDCVTEQDDVDFVEIKSMIVADGVFNPNKKQPVWGYKIGGTVILKDGHHRSVVNSVMGRPNPVHIVDIDQAYTDGLIKVNRDVYEFISKQIAVSHPDRIL